MKITKKSVLELMASGYVQATMVGGQSIEDWLHIVSMVKKDFPDAKEFDDKIEFDFSRPGVCRCIRKPKVARLRKGTFRANSKTYYFEWEGKTSSGDVASLKLLEDGSGLELEMFNGARMQYRPLTAAA
ncbi:hypothetical protein [Hydrogenophaga sp. NFH-34]|uniref:hypothetical protein n=1 Tax=Hydrogenophaga sp. NFH-34 TaxID=2744446 RepID=UPI001F24B351|nr:hypothetical protein [Hydrogenophaga sp. NFH-34]